MFMSVTGVPAITLPVSLSQNGLPIGLQLIGQHFREQQMLSAAKWIEQQCQFPGLNLDFLDQISWNMLYLQYSRLSIK